MNIFVQKLAGAAVDPAPELRPTALVVEDNVGEAIHVHFRNVRLEMSVDEYERFADSVAEAVAHLDDGNR